jgi:hypothetical protein
VPKKATKARQTNVAPTKIKIEVDREKSSSSGSSSSSSSSSGSSSSSSSSTSRADGLHHSLAEPFSKSSHTGASIMPVTNAEIESLQLVDQLAVSEGTARTEAVSTHGRVGRGKNKKYADFENTRTRRKDQTESLDECSKGTSSGSGIQGGMAGDPSVAKGVLEADPGSQQQCDSSSSCSLRLNSRAATSTSQPHCGLYDSTSTTASVPVSLHSDKNSGTDISSMFGQENGDGGLVKG